MQEPARALRSGPGRADSRGIPGQDAPGRRLREARTRRVSDIASSIAANGPLAVRAVLRTIRDSEGLHENDAWKADAEVGAEVFASTDAEEGPRAFMDKRHPKFEGR